MRYAGRSSRAPDAFVTVGPHEQDDALTRHRAADRDHGGAAHARHRLPVGPRADLPTIAPYTIEEAYEVADAIARGDLADLRDELGDLLLQVVFHARMAQEQGAFAFADVVQAVTEKLIRRHPHVFGDVKREDTAAVKGLWDRIKAEERAAKRAAGRETPAGREGALAGVPVGLPALTRALKLQQKASKVGFDWNDPQGRAGEDPRGGGRDRRRARHERTREGRRRNRRSVVRRRQSRAPRRCRPRDCAAHDQPEVRAAFCLDRGCARGARQDARARRRSPRWTRSGMRRRLRSNSHPTSC